MSVLHLLRELALFFGPIIGVVVVGQEAEGTVEETIAVERAMAFKFTASATEKVSSLSIKLGAVSGTGTSGRLALQADEGGTKPKEGVLCEGPIASVAAGEHTTTSLTAEPTVTSGTVYWLTIMPLGGNAKIKCGTTTSRQKTSVNRSLISIIVAADWAGSVTKGPAAIWATGAGATPSGSGAISGGGNVTASGSKVASGTPKVTGGGNTTGTGSRRAVGSATVTGAGGVSQSGARIAKGSGAVTGAGRTSATGTAPGAHSGSGVVHGGGNVAATGSRRASSAAAVTGGGVTSASTSSRRSGAGSVQGGGNVGATFSTRRAVATALVHGGGLVTATGAALGLTVRVTGGGNVVATGVAGPTYQFPLGQPRPGHASVGQVGRLGAVRGRITSGNQGRAS